MIISTKIYTKKNNNNKKWTNRTLRQMVKAKLYQKNHTTKHTHTHSEKEKKENTIYIYKIKRESNQSNKQIYQ